MLEDDNTDDVESEGDEVVYFECGGSCSRFLRLEDRVVDMMVDDGGEESRCFNAGYYLVVVLVSSELSVRII